MLDLVAEASEPVKEVPEKVSQSFFQTVIKWREDGDAVSAKRKEQRAEEMLQAKKKREADQEKAFQAARDRTGQPVGVSNNMWKMACFVVRGEILTDRKRDRRGANASWNGRWMSYSSWNGGKWRAHSFVPSTDRYGRRKAGLPDLNSRLRSDCLHV